MNKPTQRVVAVEREARGDTAEPSVWNRPLPRWARWLLGLLALAIAAMVLPKLNVLHVYQKHFRANAPQIALRFEELNARMDEAALRQHFQGLPLTCIPETQSALGDRVCYAGLGKVNGERALTLALFTRKGRLSSAVVQVPWWSHGRWQSRFVRDWGTPVPAGADDTGMPVLRWKMPGGAVEMNKRRYLNPLEYSVVFWMAEK